MRRLKHWLPLLGITWLPLQAAPPSLTLDLGNGVSLDLVLAPRGSFTQGSPSTEPDRGTDESQRPVTLTRDFYIAKTAVTRAQWERFATETHYRTEAESGPSGGFGWDGNGLVQRKEFTWQNPGFPQGSDHPVTIVTAPDAEAFCRWLSQKTRRRVTLPTEAQWEYACRAGTTGAWHQGDSPATASRIFWSKDNSGHATHPVASTTPNAWGLHIGGNVAEWCADIYANYAPAPQTDPLQKNPDPGEKPRRVLRGGSWNRGPANTRSAARFRADGRSRNADTGFRIVCSVELIPAPQPAANRPPTTPAPFPSTSSPPPHPSTPQPAPPPRSGSSLGRILLLMLPIGLIALVVILLPRLLRRAGTPASGAQSYAPRPPIAGGASGVRIVDDGFWMLLDSVPPGSRVHYAFQPPGGMETNGDVAYQPGAEGQFVYTGVRPESARVTNVETSGDPLPNQTVIHRGGPGARGVGFGIGSTTGPSSTSRRGHSTDFTNDAPPRNPAAY